MNNGLHNDPLNYYRSCYCLSKSYLIWSLVQRIRFRFHDEKLTHLNYSNLVVGIREDYQSKKPWIQRGWEEDK